MTKPSGSVARSIVFPTAGVIRWKQPALLFGMALVSLQALWILALPAFFGIDEFDHAYRAASVADGHWAPGTAVPDDGRGYLLRVPADIVTAAHSACDALDYTQPDNCTATTAPDQDNTVLIASAAATYNPVWYAIVGTAGKPFSGDTALFVMRIVGTLLCDVFLVAAAAFALRRRTSVWPFLGVILVATPTLIYATTVAAPNGLSYSAGVLMWAAGLHLLRTETVRPRTSVVAVTIAAATVMFTHTTGIVWVLLGLVCTIPLWWGRGRALVHRDRLAFVASGAALGITAAACATWILRAHTNDPSENSQNFGPMPPSLLLLGPILWTLQAIATLRFRDALAPTVVYGLAGALFIVISFIAVRVAPRRIVLSLALIATAATAVPLLLTYLSYNAIGSAWQGRYGLPLSVGLLLVAVEALRSRPPPTPGVIWGLFGLLAVSQALTVSAAFRESQTGSLHNPIALVLVGGVVYLVTLGIAAQRYNYVATSRLDANAPNPDSATSRPDG